MVGGERRGEEDERGPRSTLPLVIFFFFVSVASSLRSSSAASGAEQPRNPVAVLAAPTLPLRARHRRPLGNVSDADDASEWRAEGGKGTAAGGEAGGVFFFASLGTNDDDNTPTTTKERFSLSF